MWCSPKYIIPDSLSMATTKELYQQRKANNLCVGCGKLPPEQNRVRCTACLKLAATQGMNHFNSLTLAQRREKYRQMICYLSRKTNRDRWNKLERARNFQLKTETINAYGGKCVCCEETEVKFLTLDHANGDGKNHRAKLGVGAGVQFYAKLKKMSFPPCGLQVMCANCHQAKSKYGVCPHQQKGQI